jgi:hydroxymethylglutaryl-CoA reductase
LSLYKYNKKGPLNSTNNKLKNNENYSTKSEIHEQTIFYTECCLLITLIIYIITKFAKLEEVTTTKKLLVKLSSIPNEQVKAAAVAVAARPMQTTTATQTTLSESTKEYADKTTEIMESQQTLATVNGGRRTLDELILALKQTSTSKCEQLLDEFQDEEVLELVKLKHIAIYKLESYFRNPLRAVALRRKIIGAKLGENSECLRTLPYEMYDYKKVTGSCCENVLGYVPVPLGVAGPLLIDSKWYHIPMATTEGTLVASTNRGCTALSSAQGVLTRVLSDGMTRGPVVEFSSAMRAAEVKEWLAKERNFTTIKLAFDSTSRFAKLETIKCCVVGKYLYIRFAAKTGDAMGMNMLSKV